MKRIAHHKRIIRNWCIFFIISLVLSGITAFAVETGLSWIITWWPEQSILHEWLYKSYEAVRATNINYPFIAYGYDWLAFGHIVIAIFFIGVLKDPVRNVWVIKTGCIACVLVIPLALIAGHIRQIPIFWRLIDCSFGVIGIIPLTIVYRNILLLEKIQHNNK
ncbi:MAG: hypothetical protein BGP13_25340 [Sphingobacteriales bacterium 40-81]|nr:MAG: hypothetical protein BGP13_25340 [Sphingobacteriales bacterium 40-81]